LKLVLVDFSRNLRRGKIEKRTVDRSVSQKNRTGSGLFLPIVKEQDFLSGRKEYRQSPILQMPHTSVNHLFARETSAFLKRLYVALTGKAATGRASAATEGYSLL